MIVVDTNVIAYLWIAGEFTARSEALLMKERKWAAPLLWRSEFRNILGGYLRKRLLSFDTALSVSTEAENMMKENEYTVTSESVMKLMRNSPCSAYDCEFVALAKDLQTPLVTSDKKILKNFPRIALPLAQFAY